MAWWLSWLERRPVTAEVVGSNPIRVASTEEVFCASFYKRYLFLDIFYMATWNGLEPSTSAVTGRHSNQLNHRANVRCLTSIYITIDLTFWQGFYAKKCNYFRFFSLNRATVLETDHQSLA